MLPRLSARHESGRIEIMSMTVDQLVSEARQLPQDLRAELLNRLGGAMHDDASPEISSEWAKIRDRLNSASSPLRRVASLIAGAACSRALPSIFEGEADPA